MRARDELKRKKVNEKIINNTSTIHRFILTWKYSGLLLTEMQRYLTIVTKWNFYNSNKVKCIQNRRAMKLKFYGSIIIQMSKISWLFINDSKSDVNIFFSGCGFHQTFFYHDRLIDWFASIVYRINIFYFPNSMIDLASESLCSASKMTAMLILTMALSKIMYRV